jgi:cell division protein FtsW
MVIMGLFFIFGLKWKYVVAMLAGAIPTFYFLVVSVPYRRARLMSFLDPWSDPERTGFQVIQSLLSFSSGGLFGVGLGEGQSKLFFLPEAHTDFTLAVLGAVVGRGHWHRLLSHLSLNTAQTRWTAHRSCSE